LSLLQVELNEIATGMNKHGACTGKPLQNEAFATEESRTQLFLERDT
jgi:hypothetical protein